MQPSFSDEGSIVLGANDDGKRRGSHSGLRTTEIGIPPQEIDNIFEEFRQGTSGRKKGPCRFGSGFGNLS